MSKRVTRDCSFPARAGAARAAALLLFLVSALPCSWCAAEEKRADLLDALPEGTVVLIGLTQPNAIAGKWDRTAVGEFLARTELEPVQQQLRKWLERVLEKERKDWGWLADQSEPTVIFVWKSAARETPRMGVAARMHDPKHRETFTAMFKQSVAEKKSTLKTIDGIDVYHNADGVMALADGLFVATPGENSMREILQALRTESDRKFARRLRWAFRDPAPDAFIAFRADALIEQFLHDQSAGNAEQRKAGEHLLHSAGLNLDHFFLTCSFEGSGFHERATWTLDGKGGAQSLLAAFVPRAGAEPPLLELSNVPTGATSALAFAVDGERLALALPKMLVGLAALQKATPPLPPPPEGTTEPALADVAAFRNALEAGMGAPPEELFRPFSGNAVLFTMPSPKGILDPPELAGYFVCANEEGAKKCADLLAKFVNTLAGRGLASASEIGTRQVYSIAVRDVGVELPERAPETFCWAVEGARLHFAFGTAVLRRHIAFVRTRSSGLLTTEGMVRQLGILTPEERRGMFLYGDSRQILSNVATLLLPWLQTQLNDAGLKRSIASIQKPQESFEALPALLATLRAEDPRTATLTVRGPLPPLLVLLGYLTVRGR